MSWSLTNADRDALSNVSIKFPNVTLDSNTLQFPPKITKDGKSGIFDEQDLGAYEPLPIYKGAKSRELGLEFQWVMGAYFVPEEVHFTISSMKDYYYGAFISVAGGSRFPIVTIEKLYEVITQTSTWRMTDLNITYSEELIKVTGIWYPLHVKVAISLKSTTKIAMDLGNSQKSPLTMDGPLSAPSLLWY